MPSAQSRPGVYVEEIPSCGRTITGVATSVTAFVGVASKGPVESAIGLNRIFGGRWNYNAMSFAARDLSLNGGLQAVIVRPFQSELTNDAGRQATADAVNTVANAAAADAIGQAAMTMRSSTE